MAASPSATTPSPVERAHWAWVQEQEEARAMLAEKERQLRLLEDALRALEDRERELEEVTDAYRKTRNT